MHHLVARWFSAVYVGVEHGNWTPLVIQIVIAALVALYLVSPFGRRPSRRRRDSDPGQPADDHPLRKP